MVFSFSTGTEKIFIQIEVVLIFSDHLKSFYQSTSGNYKRTKEDHRAKQTNYLVASLHNAVYPFALNWRERAALRNQRRVFGELVTKYNEFSKSWRKVYSVWGTSVTHQVGFGIQSSNF